MIFQLFAYSANLEKVVLGDFRIIALLAIYDFRTVGRIAGLKFVGAWMNAMKMNCGVAVIPVFARRSITSARPLSNPERTYKIHACHVRTIETFVRKRKFCSFVKIYFGRQI